MARLVECCLAFLALFVLQCFRVQEVLSAKAHAGNTAGFSNANFVEHLLYYLNVTQVGSSLVNEMEDCAFRCLRVVTCFSFNLGANRDIEGRLTCELLGSDIYNASDKFQPNPEFHHFSICNPCSQKPCMNGGKCIALYFHDDFKCECPVNVLGKICEIRFGCSFDADTCGFTQSQDDRFDWSRHHGSTTSSNTGPNADNSGTGHYMYIETSPPRKKGDAAKMWRTILLTGRSCLSFYYHMYGGNIGSLEVKVGGQRLFIKVGNQGNHWIRFEARLSGSGDKELEFEAIAGGAYTADAAIDDVHVYDC